MTENKTVQIAHSSPILAAGCRFGGFQEHVRCMLNADEGDIPGFEITSRAWLVVSYAPAAKVPKLRSALIVRLAYAHSPVACTSKPSESWTQEPKTEAAAVRSRGE